MSAGTYTLSESAGPAGYTASTWSCTAGTLTEASLVLPVGTSATCTINNNDQAAHLTLIKTVTNDSGGTAVPTAWTLTGTGPTVITGATGSAPVTNAAVNAGTYVLTESGGPSGYAAGPWTCTGATASGNQVTVPLGGTVSCTINNNDQPATLTLVKVVVNQNGGTAAPADWTLSATGPTSITGPGNSAAVTGQPVNAGTYALTETNGPAGYTASTWSCTAGTLTGSSLVLPNGISATCTITNTDQAAHLTLVKVVVNGTTGATGAPPDWTLSAVNGATTVSGPGNSAQVTNVAVPAGTYALSETGPAGYTPSTWSCTGGNVTGTNVAVPNGGDVTCTITNTAVAPRLTLVKRVDNGTTGATTVPSAFTLTAVNGASTITGAGNSADVTDQAGIVGTYTLSESNLPGYTPSAWVCTGGTATTGTSVTLAPGSVATCTITNTAVAPRLTLVKVVDNGTTGATTAPSAFTLTAVNGASTITGPGNSAPVTNQAGIVGTYALSESTLPGYTASTWVCTGGTATTGTSVVLALGSVATCTITNTAQQPHLTLVKTVTNDNGGTALPTAWTLTATGPTTPISGATGTATVTDVPVEIGNYGLAESGGPGGYTPSGWTCVNGTQNGAAVSVALGDDVTCTINNDDQPATLTLVKVVQNGTTGATAVPADWTLSADGPTAITGPGNTPPVTSQTVDAGSYALAEAGGPSGYTPSGWTCTGGTLTGSSVAVANGGDVTCTISNTAIAPRLTLVKVVDNGNTGATTPPSAFTLTAVNGASTITGPGNAPAVTDQAGIVGTYDLSETTVPGYTASDWVCTGGVTTTATSVELTTGSDATCTITNTAVQPKLTLVKDVVNDDVPGADAAAEDFTLTAVNGAATITGPGNTPPVTDQDALVGTYTLSETTVPGYTASGWVCTGGVETTATSVTLTTGSDATCTVTNTAQPATLTLVKHVDNGDTGSTAVPADFTLTATGGTDTVTGPGGSDQIVAQVVTPDTYALSETENPQYAFSQWQCTVDGVVQEPAASVDVGLGQNATCEITNTAIPGTWTVTKSSDPVSGSTVLPGSVITYTVTATHLDGTDPHNVVVNDDLSAVLDHASFVTGSITQSTGTATLSGTTLTWDIPVLSEQETVTYQVKVDDDAFGVQLQNVVTSPGSEPCTPVSALAAAAAAATTVQPRLAPAPPTTDDPSCDSTHHETPAWSLSKSSDPASGSTVPVGSTITYTLKAVNTFTAPVIGAVATDDLSAVLAHGTLVAVPAGATLDGTTLTWNIPTLAAMGDSAELTYQVKLDDDAFDVSVTNVVTPGSGGTCTTCTTTHTTPPQPVLPVTPSEPSLPKTGTDITPFVGVALLLLMLGAGAVYWARRRREE